MRRKISRTNGRRTAALLLAASLVVGTSGCGSSTAPQDASQAAQTQTTQAQTGTETVSESQAGAETAQEPVHWDLTDIFASDQEFEDALREISEEWIPRLAAYRGTLEDPEQVYGYFKTTDEFRKLAIRISNYAELKCEQNQGDNVAMAQYQKAQQMETVYSEATAGIEAELMALPDALWEELLAQERMAPYVREITQLRANRDHTLSEEEELLLIPLYNAVTSMTNVYAKLVNADMVFPTVTGSKGEEFATDENSMSITLTSNPNQEDRKKVGEGNLSAYGQFRNTLAQNMDGYVQGMVALSRLHHYGSARENAMISSNVPEVVYDNLMTAVDHHLDAAKREVALRKKIMGVDQIYSSDMQIPLTEDAGKYFSYEDAQEIIIKALEPLGEEYGQNLQKAFDENWIDLYPSEGKSTGAFAMPVSSVHPYVLTNYTNDFYSLHTLAHELGHAMHQYSSSLAQKSDYDSNPTTFTTEVASTTNELLVMDYLIDHGETEEEKQFYRFSELTLLKNTFFTQAMFAEFEEKMYQIVEDGGSLSADVLEALWMETAERYYSEDCVLIEGYEYGWSRIPHFYRNFYVYQYATSIAAACRIAERIEAGDEEAIQAYLTFLKSGDSADGAELLALAGVDMTSPNLADSLIDRYNGLMDEIEENLGQ